MDATAFLKSIAGRLRQCAQIMSRRYPTVGMTADDFQQEAIAVLLGRLAGNKGARGPQATITYDPDAAEPWTFAYPIVQGAMIDAALRNAKSVEFFSPKQIKQLSEESAAILPNHAETTNLSDRFIRLANSVGESLTSEEADTLARVYGGDATQKEAAAERNESVRCIDNRLYRIASRLRAAAGANGIQAFN